MTKEIATFSLTPSNLNEAMQFSEMIAASSLVPRDFKNKPGDTLVAIQMGSELGLPPMQALQNIAVINGRPCVWGDALPALAKNHPKYEKMEETFDESTMTATCVIKRKGEKAEVRTFSQADAQVAGLWNKEGTWKKYPKRMLQMRARSFAIRDVFPDALKGLYVAEDALDIPEKDMGEAERVEEPAVAEEQTLPEEQILPAYTDEQIDENEESFKQMFAASKSSPEHMIGMISSKYSMTEKQITRINEMAPNGEVA